jgi:hypothetical protein
MMRRTSSALGGGHLYASLCMCLCESRLSEVFVCEEKFVATRKSKKEHFTRRRREERQSVSILFSGIIIR